MCFNRLIIALLVCDLALAGLEAPQKAGQYDKDFFEQHRKNAPAYVALVQVLSEFVLEGFARGTALGDVEDVSVLDVGCGHGLLVEAWRSVGLLDSFCIEGAEDASHMWPPQYSSEFYVLHDLEDVKALAHVQPTDFVTSFEVGEHLRPAAADHYVELLTMHHPQLVFFGAATPFQDRGKNPSHVNENTFAYWIKRFAARGFHVDWAKTATAKHKLVTLSDPHARQAVMSAWWYPKNLLIFAPDEDRELTDKALIAHPKQADMLSPSYLNMAGQGEFGMMWKRDWTKFGKLFYKAQKAARRRAQRARKRQGGEM